jgi:hypothetical protein
VKLKLTERHRNGALFEAKGKPKKVVPLLIEWRKYQDGTLMPRNAVGFTKDED